MKTYNIAILGASGAVGQQMIQVLEERSFPVGKLLPLASEIIRGILPEPQPAPDHMPEGVKIYEKGGVRLFLRR